MTPEPLGPVGLLALASLLTWVGLLMLRGGFWRLREWLPTPQRMASWPSVAIMIPARDEAATIAAAVRSVLGQRYPGRLELIVVDDSSRDGTPTLASTAGAEAGTRVPVTVLTSPPVPAGWTGKVWALSQAERYLAGRADAPAYLWLCDADIVHDNDLLARLVWKAERDRCDLVSLMVLLTAGGFWGRLLIPPFVLFFRKLYPFAWVNDPGRRTAAAAGGCVLLRWRALRAAGGFGAIAGAIIDDCALARRIKDLGPNRRIWLGLTRSARSLRPNAGIREIASMVARSAYAQLGYRPAALALCVGAMGWIYLLPPALVPVAVGGGWPVVGLLACGAWGGMVAASAPVYRLYGRSAAWGLALPLAAALYTGITLYSAWAHVRGRGGRWKGRAQALGPRHPGCW